MTTRKKGASPKKKKPASTKKSTSRAGKTPGVKKKTESRKAVAKKKARTAKATAKKSRRAAPRKISSEDIFRAAYENSPIGIELFDGDGFLVDTNRAGLESFGVKDVGELRGFSFFEDPMFPEDMKAELRRGNAVRYEAVFDFDEARRLGLFDTERTGTIVLDMHFVPIPAGRGGKIGGYLAQVQDITEREDVERALRNSERKYRELFDSATDGIFIVDFEGNLVDVNATAHERLGYTKGEMLSMNLTGLATPEFSEKVPGRFSELSEKGVAVFESAHRRKDGSVMPVEVNARIMEYGGGRVLFSIIRDITERKEAEDRIRESESRFRTIFEQATEGIMMADIEEKRQIEANIAACEMLGYTREELLGTSVEDLHPKEDLHRVFDIFQRQVRGEISLAPDIPMLRKDGTVIYADVNSTSVTLKGRQCLLGFFRDITERKEAADRLKERERQLSESQRIAHIGSWEHNLTTNEAVWSDELFRVLGLDPEKDPADFDMFFSMIHPEDQPVLKKAIAETLETGKHFSVEYRFIFRDGRTRILHAQAELVTDKTGTQKILSGTGQDVTERREAEDRIRESEARFRGAFESAAVGASMASLKGRFIKVNRALCDMLGYTEDELLQKTFSDVTFPEDIEIGLDAAKKLVAGEITYTSFEKRYVRKDGRLINVVISPTIIRDAEGKPLHFLAMFQDVTERKQVEDRLREALGEKDVLLKEIHHRVKNNMAIVSALLHLQSRYSSDEGINKILKDSQNRIYSMAMVHEKLYESENLSSIRVREYVRELVHHLLDGYADREIRFEHEIDDIKLDIDNIIPLGLIINELVTNSVKHAFTGEGSPKIGLSLNANDSMVELVYRDSGAGLPEGTSPANAESLGLKIVQMLSYQLKGSISLDEKDRSRFTLSFPLQKD